MDLLLDELVSGAGLSLGDPLAEAAWQVRALATEPLPAETRERHLARIRQTLAPPARVRPFLGLRRRVAVLATAVTAALTFSGGVTYAAAQQALPGDALYGLKRATERLALVVERDPAEDAKLQVSFAQRRLREAAASPDRVDELVAEAIEELEAAASAPGIAGAQSLDVIRELLEGRLLVEGRLLEVPASEQARFALAQVCVKLALQRREDIPLACAAEAGTPPPAPDSEVPPQSRAPGAGEQAPGAPPPAGQPPAEQPAAPPPAGQPPAEQPAAPPAEQPAAPPPGGPPAAEPPPPAQPPPDGDETTSKPQPPDQDPGRDPRGRGKGRPEREYRAPDAAGGPSGSRVQARGRSGEHRATPQASGRR